MPLRIRFLLSLLALCLLSPAALHAQRKRKAQPQQPRLSVEELMQAYRFTEAIAQLQTDVDAARRAGVPANRQEADLRRAQMGQSMLLGVEKVMVIDSMAVPRAALSSLMRPGTGCGTVMPMDEVKNLIDAPMARTGQTAYANDWGDRLTYAAADSLQAPTRLYGAWREGNRWTSTGPLPGLDEEGMEYDFPYFLSDGVTLYFAAQGEESLGGYDIFRTRYDAGAKAYLKAEHLGMPFNSPANDYLMVINEDAQLGWFVSDRFQPADSVCIYTFVPDNSPETYLLTDSLRQHITQVARLQCIALTQTDAQAVQQARMRHHNLRQTAATQGTATGRYVICDDTVYHSLTQFKSEAARRIAMEADAVARKLTTETAELDALQRTIGQGRRTAEMQLRLRELQQDIPQLRDQLHTLQKNYRKAELQQ